MGNLVPDQRTDGALEDILKSLADVPLITDADRLELVEGAEALAKDPEWYSDYLKAAFTTAVLAAMKEEKLNQSQLAAKWSKSRQYVSKLFSEDSDINFTVETMVDLAFQINRRVAITLLRPGEIACISHDFTQILAQVSEVTPPCWGGRIASPLYNHHGDYRDDIGDYGDFSMAEHHEQRVPKQPAA